MRGLYRGCTLTGGRRKRPDTGDFEESEEAVNTREKHQKDVVNTRPRHVKGRDHEGLLGPEVKVETFKAET